MKSPSLPQNETARLSALRESGLLEIENHPTYDRLTRLAKRLFGVPVAMINLVDEHVVVVKSANGADATNLPRNLSFCGHTVLNEAPLVVPDTLDDARFADNPLATDDDPVRFYAGYPLHLPNGATVGSLCIIDHQPRQFSPADVEALADLAALVEVEFAATCATIVDDLTGLYNRRGFHHFATYAIGAARRRAEPLTLAWLDLDRFKQINARHGRADGDTALKAMAGLLSSTFREADVLARYGGDEFAILFASSDEKGAWIAMQYLTEQAAVWNEHAEYPWALSFSWGVIEFNHDRDDLESWLKTADRMMYSMKQQRGTGC
ncbi:sensor domain-containing diguanylate cyclase [Leclercia sp.]|uniref:sensor domain-containing diguanylate cyclase n=1 Tax=Leclercia sp. TaxID=1898428 RepID=UPI002FDE8E08